MMTPEAAQANTNKPANVVWGIGVLVAFGLLIAFSSRI